MKFIKINYEIYMCPWCFKFVHDKNHKAICEKRA